MHRRPTKTRMESSAADQILKLAISAFSMTTASRTVTNRTSTRGRAFMPGPSSFPYSPECVEGKFSELRPNGVLGNSCRLSSMETAPVASQQPVVDTVFVGSPLLVVLRSGTFVTHPDLLHHPPGGRVAPEVLRVDAVKP